MWSSISALLTSRLSAYTSIIKMVLVLALLAVVSAAVYRVYDAFASQRENKVVIEHQKETIAQKDAVINEQTNQAMIAEQGKKIEDQLILKLDTTTKVKDKAANKIIQQLDVAIEKISVEPDLTDRKKSDAVAKAVIDAVWQQYCSTQADDPGCKDSHAEDEQPAEAEHAQTSQEFLG